MPEVPLTAELVRVAKLPRRWWSDADKLRIHAEVDAFVRRPGGKMSLYPDQAWALYELASGGVFVNMPVGGGKSVISLLAPLFAMAQRPLLFVPASLKEKTLRDQQRYGEHFRVPNYLKIESYELLGTVGSSKMLDEYNPDLVICDEVHFLRNPMAARTRRMRRFVHAKRPRTLGLTGSPGDSIKDYWHLFDMTLGDKAPVPVNQREVNDWAKHLDKRENRIDPGALLSFCTAEELQQPEPARLGFRRRVAETKGIVSTVGASDSDYNGPLIIDFDKIDPPPFLLEKLADIRKGTGPNGEEFDDPLVIHRHAREMALGVFTFWDPPPPKPWLEARRKSHRVNRKILTTNRRNLDSPLQVINAIDAGLYPDDILCGEDEESINPIDALADWREIKETYRENKTAGQGSQLAEGEFRKIPAWLSTFFIEHLARKVGGMPPTVFWVNQVAVGDMLSKATGMPYYGGGGLDKNRNDIERDPGGHSIIASIHANRRGRNLQDRWSHNYFIDPPPNEEAIEQGLGRTHRNGQQADSVVAWFAHTTLEHEFSIQRAIAESKVVFQTWGHKQKLLLADFVTPFTYPDVHVEWSGP